MDDTSARSQPRSPDSSPDGVLVEMPRRDLIGLWVFFPFAGAALFWLIRLLSELADRLRHFPVPGPLRWIAAIDEPYASGGAVLLGLTAGLLLSGWLVGRQLSVWVAADAVALRWRNGRHRSFGRDEVEGVCVAGKRLVLLGPGGAELAWEEHELPVEELKGALRAHGYTWLDRDPYADEFRLWVPETPGLPDGANALLVARREAVRKGQDDEAAELRSELLRLGVVVHDRRKRQYWRTAPRLARRDEDREDDREE